MEASGNLDHPRRKPEAERENSQVWQCMGPNKPQSYVRVTVLSGVVKHRNKWRQTKLKKAKQKLFILATTTLILAETQQQAEERQDL